MSKPPARPGPRGLLKEDIVSAAVAFHDEVGEEGFSVRKLAARLGCDPMAVLYHFGSKEGLERAIGDSLHAELPGIDTEAPWRARLSELARQIRLLAERHPRSFPLLRRFWITGPADWRQAEAIYGALADAGFSGSQLVDIGCGWHAAVLGLVTADAAGILAPAGDAEMTDVESLPDREFPAVRALLPTFRKHRDRSVFLKMHEIILDGISAQLS